MTCAPGVPLLPHSFPWNSCGAYMAATLGVTTWSYAPYASFSFLSPSLTVVVAYAGIRMLRETRVNPT